MLAGHTRVCSELRSGSLGQSFLKRRHRLRTLGDVGVAAVAAKRIRGLM